MEKTLDVNERSFSSLISPRFRSAPFYLCLKNSSTQRGSRSSLRIESSRFKRSVRLRSATYDSEGLITDVHANAHRTLIYPKQTHRTVRRSLFKESTLEITNLRFPRNETDEWGIYSSQILPWGINGHEWASNQMGTKELESDVFVQVAWELGW